MTQYRYGLMMAFGLGLLSGQAEAQVRVDAALPGYSATSGVSGNIKSVGSDTMNNEMTLWAEGFRKHYPSVKVEIEGKGSSTAPPAPLGTPSIPRSPATGNPGC